MSVDVGCVATGVCHDARDVYFVAVVDGNERQRKSNQKNQSGIQGRFGLCRDVIAEVKALLGHDVVLVGQGIQSNINWLHLHQGVDYAETVDLAEMFKTYNSRYGRYNYYSLSQHTDSFW